jgi:hypothetical protein
MITKPTITNKIILNCIERKRSSNWNTNFALHTKGKGFYENYKEDADFSDYGLQPVGWGNNTDLVRQKWLDNDFTEPHFQRTTRMLN